MRFIETSTTPEKVCLKSPILPVSYISVKYHTYNYLSERLLCRRFSTCILAVKPSPKHKFDFWMYHGFKQNRIYRGVSHGGQCPGKSKEYNLLKSLPLICESWLLSFWEKSCTLHYRESKRRIEPPPMNNVASPVAPSERIIISVIIVDRSGERMS